MVQIIDADKIKKDVKAENNKLPDVPNSLSPKFAAWREAILEAIGVNKPKLNSNPPLKTVVPQQTEQTVLPPKKEAAPSLSARPVITKLLPVSKFPLLLPRPKFHKSRRFWFITLPLIFLIFLYSGFYLLRFDRGFPSVARFLPWPAAYVGGQLIWQSDLAKEVNSLLIIQKQQESKTKIPRDELENMAFKILLNRLLIDNALAKYHLTVSADIKKREYDSLLNGFDSQQALESFLLKTYGFNWQQFEQNVFEPYLKTTVLEKYLSGQPGVFEEASMRAQNIRQRILNNELTFVQAATKLNDDKQAALRNGDLGWIERSILSPQIAGNLEKLKIGEPSEPIKTELGYELLSVTGVLPIQSKTIAEANSIRLSYILVQAVKLEDWLKTEADRAGVVKLLPF